MDVVSFQKIIGPFCELAFEIVKAGVSASKFCRVAITYGVMMCLMYWNMVCALDQCLCE